MNRDAIILLILSAVVLLSRIMVDGQGFPVCDNVDTNCVDPVPLPYIMAAPEPVTLAWNHTVNSDWLHGNTNAPVGCWDMILQSSNNLTWLPLVPIDSPTVSNTFSFMSIYRYQFYRIESFNF